MITPSVIQALRRENGEPDDLSSYEGLPVYVREHWTWGWVIQKGA